MKAGVSISPLLVIIFPNLAPEFSFNNLNEHGMRGLKEQQFLQ